MIYEIKRCKSKCSIQCKGTTKGRVGDVEGGWGTRCDDLKSNRIKSNNKIIKNNKIKGKSSG